jgi:enoyl-CoA hydratase/carnithine racemase
MPHLVRRVASATALRWALSGATVDAIEASVAGLVTTVCEAGQAEATARALATELATGPRGVVTEGMRWYHETRTA